LGQDTTRRRLVTIATRAAAIALGLFLLEVGYRAFLWARGVPHDSAAVEARLAAFASESAERTIDGRRRWRSLGYRIHPYMGFVTPKYQAELAARKAHYDAHRDSVHVAVFGGSVAESCFNSQSLRFRGLLRAHAALEGREVFVINAALSGYKQPQQVNELAYLIALGIVPDVAVNIDGYNELAVATHNLGARVHPAFPSLSLYAHLAVASSREQETIELIAGILRDQRALGSRASTALDLGLYRSSIATHLVMPALGALAADVDEGFRSYESVLTRAPIEPVNPATIRQYDHDRVTLSGPFPEGGFSDPLATLADIWETSSRSMQGICDAHGILYVHVLQPTLHDEGSKPLTPAEVEGGRTSDEQRDAVRRGYPLLRERGASLARDGVRFLDASRIFAEVEDELYFDVCHFQERGEAMLADAIASFVLDELGERPR
jgi:hypothetical protein